MNRLVWCCIATLSHYCTYRIKSALIQFNHDQPRPQHNNTTTHVWLNKTKQQQGFKNNMSTMAMLTCYLAQYIYSKADENVIICQYLVINQFIDKLNDGTCYNKVITIHPEENMDLCSKFHVNPSDYWNILVRIVFAICSRSLLLTWLKRIIKGICATLCNIDMSCFNTGYVDSWEL